MDFLGVFLISLWFFHETFIILLVATKSSDWHQVIQRNTKIQEHKPNQGGGCESPPTRLSSCMWQLAVNRLFEHIWD